MALAAVLLPARAFAAPCARRARRLALWFLVVLLVPAAVSAAPWMWDQDTDGLDDRLKDVFLGGINQAYENLDPGGRLRFEVELVNSVLQYGGYVLYDHVPTPADSTNLVLAGASVVTRFTSVPYIRIRGAWPTLLAVKLDPTVIRIEAVSLFYALNWREGHATGVRHGFGPPFLVLEDGASPTGQGVVVAILDTGINDTSQGSFPGHSDLAGRILGGAWYGGQGPAGYTPWNGTTNPSQTALALSSYHATHIAGTIAGGSRSRTFGGVAPGARLVDVKVLDDSGTGNGLAEGLQWVLHNRNRAWGLGWTGIDIVNLSLSGTDPSDGGDCVSRLVNAAVAQGLVVVSSAGNEGTCGALPAPASADGAITVGAFDPGSSSDPGDDLLAAFSSEGPRASDDDGSLLDEMKPDLVAPGVAVVSASGSPLESGHHYETASGTSMSAAIVSGAAALLLEADPSLTPADVKRILRETAVRRSGSPHGCTQGPDPFGLDLRYHAAWGYGQLDAYAAWQEAVNDAATQFVRLRLDWRDLDQVVRITWSTQREIGLTGFHVQRAPDAGGAPGTFVTVTPAPLPAVGSSSLGGANRTTYLYDDAALAGAMFWYRVVTIGGPPETSPALAVRTEVPVALATMVLSHNTPESDLSLTIGVGANTSFPAWSRPVDGADLAAAVLPDPEVPGYDLARYTYCVKLYGEASPHLPPAPGTPWFLAAAEAGDAYRSGTLDNFEIDTSSGNYPTDTLIPKPTLEGSTSVLWIPEPATSAAGDVAASDRPVLFASPNPFRGATRLQFQVETSERVRLSVLDVQGREVRVIADQVLDRGGYTWTWDGRDAGGRKRPAGHYYVRLARSSGSQVIPLVFLD